MQTPLRQIQASSRPWRQSGITLITVLVLLVIVTLLAVSAGRNATEGEMIARASRARQVSQQAAEAALVDARNMLGILGFNFSALNQIQQSNDSLFDSGSASPGFFNFNGTPVWSAAGTQWIKRGDRTKNAGGAVSAFVTSGAAGVYAEPGYVVEKFQAGPDPDQAGSTFYRITARGYGPTSRTLSFVQETVVRQEQGAINPLN